MPVKLPSRSITGAVRKDPSRVQRGIVHGAGEPSTSALRHRGAAERPPLHFPGSPGPVLTRAQHAKIGARPAAAAWRLLQARLVRIPVLSDLHVEVSPFAPPRTDADLVILAGDIHNGTEGLDWGRQSFPEQHIVYVPGNHEHYDRALAGTARALADRADGLGITLLDTAAAVIGGVRFLGTTLWTDFCL